MTWELDASCLANISGLPVLEGDDQLVGSIFVPPPPTPQSGSLPAPSYTAPAQGKPVELVFASLASPDGLGSCAVLVTETAFSGDLFRSGPVGALPVSPAKLCGLIVSNAGYTDARYVTTVNSLNDWLANNIPGTTVPINVGIGHLFKVQSATLDSAVISLKAGIPETVTLTVTGTLLFWSFFFKETIAFTLTVDMTIGPSHDPSDGSRVLAFTPGQVTVTGLGLVNFTADAVGSILAGTVISLLEARANGMIAPAVSSQLAQVLELQPTATAVLSAVKVTLKADSTSMTVSIGDLFGPGTEPIPGNLNVTINPSPRYDVAVDYTVTVTKASDDSAVAGAQVVIAGPASSDNPPPQETNNSGTTTFRGVTLKAETVTIRGQSVPLVPFLTVSAEHFNSYMRRLY